MLSEYNIMENEIQLTLANNLKNNSEELFTLEHELQNNAEY